MTMIDKLINICFREFCDIAGDSPCGCDCCPYGEFGSENNECYEEYKKDKLKALEALQTTMSEWISVKDRLPESGVHILAAVNLDGAYCNGQYVCDAFYAAKYTQSVSGYSDECSCEYCEEDDEYYLEEGWYEVIKNWDDYNSISSNDTVTHWMPLPEPPKGE